MKYSCLAWSPSGLFIAFGSVNGEVLIYNVYNAGITRGLSREPKKSVVSVDWSAHGQIAGVLVGDKTRVKIWDQTTGAKLFNLGGIQESKQAKWSHDGTMFATAMGDCVKIFDALTFKQVRYIDQEINNLDWTADNRKLAIGSTNCAHINIVDIGSGLTCGSINNVCPNSFSCCPNNTTILMDHYTDENISEVRVIDYIDNHIEVAEPWVDEFTGIHDIEYVDWHCSGRYFAASGPYDGIIKVWDNEKFQCHKYFNCGVEGKSIVSPRWSHDGNMIANLCDDKMYVWSF